MKICSGWQGAFSRVNSFNRAVAMSLGLLCGIGRGTASRAILALGRKDVDWTADYRLCSRSPWDAEALFTSALKKALTRVPGNWCVLAYDAKLCFASPEGSRRTYSEKTFTP